MLILLATATLMSLTLAIVMSIAYRSEKKRRLVLEHEAENFHTVLLDNLSDWKGMQVERDAALERCAILAQTNDELVKWVEP